MPILTLDPPVQGIVRRSNFQVTAPFSAYDLTNVFPVDPSTGRANLATRPPLVPINSPGATVNMIERVNGVGVDRPLQSLVIARNGQAYWWNGTDWTAATGAQAGSIPTDYAVYAQTFLSKTYIGVQGNASLVFDYAAGTVTTLTASEGVLPTGLRGFAVFEGALAAFGNDANPHVLYVSRTGDATDWDFGVAIDDEGGAFATAGENEGLFRGPITAIFSHADDRLVVSTLEGLVLLRGHPRRGGRIDPFGTGIYILGQGAVCKTPDDNAFFLTNRGLMNLSPAANGVPTFVSRDRIPDELIGISFDLDDPAVSLAYDSRWNAIIITVRQTEITSQQAWLYDLNFGGFFKIDAEFMPHHLVEFPPFVTLNKSGVIWAGEGFGGLATMQRFVDDAEEFQSRAIIGPIQTAEVATHGRKVQQLDFVFGNELDDMSGVVNIAVGRDGEDAINRIRGGLPQYQVSLSTLAANMGRCFPNLLGGALAIEIIASRPYTLQSILAKLGDTASRNLQVYAPRISPEVTEDTIVQFSAATWKGYVPIQAAAASQTLTDFTHLLDLSELADVDEFWANVRPSGADIRVTDTSNGIRPSDLIHFDRTNRTGLLAFKMSTSGTSALDFRLWVGNQFAFFPTGENGRFGAYDSNWLGFWPDGGGNDRTRNGVNLTAQNDLVFADTDGPIGAKATTYEGAEEQHALATITLQSLHPLTLQGFATNADPNTAGQVYGILGICPKTYSSTAFQNAAGLAEFSSSNTFRCRARHTDDGGSSSQADANASNAASGHLYTAVFTSASSRAAFIDGASKATNSTSESLTADIANRLVVGAREGKDDITGSTYTFYSGRLSLLSAHNVARPDAWVARWGAMLTQSTFYTPSAFVTVN